MGFPWENKYRASQWNELATYNAEVARGIVHTPEWQHRMAELQADFDSARYSVGIDTCRFEHHAECFDDQAETGRRGCVVHGSH